jgi:hypothetical protein
LPPAQVRFIPEAFLGEDTQIARGKTDPNGVAVISIETTGTSDPSGIAPGLYRVEITQDGELVPPKYDSEILLGEHTAMGVPCVRAGIRFNPTY